MARAARKLSDLSGPVRWPFPWQGRSRRVTPPVAAAQAASRCDREPADDIGREKHHRIMTNRAKNVPFSPYVLAGPSRQAVSPRPSAGVDDRPPEEPGTAENQDAHPAMIAPPC